MQRDTRMEKRAIIFWLVPSLPLVSWMSWHIIRSDEDLLGKLFVLALIWGFVLVFPIRMIIEMYLIKGAGQVVRNIIKK